MSVQWLAEILYITSLTSEGARHFVACVDEQQICPHVDNRNQDDHRSGEIQSTVEERSAQEKDPGTDERLKQLQCVSWHCFIYTSTHHQNSLCGAGSTASGSGG